MKKILCILFALAAFCNCNTANENEISIWDKIQSEMDKTELSAVEVILSADYWLASKAYYYTEPNAQGEEKIGYDLGEDGHLDGANPHMFRMLIDGVYRRYSVGISNPDPSKHIPANYMDFKLEIDDNGVGSIYKDDKKYSFRVIAYDEKSILIESDFWCSHKFNSKAEIVKTYPYGRVFFKRQVATSSDWEDLYMSEEELQKYKDENHNK